ncbi:EthD family reductase [Pseudokineococcus basanitobsidens]|uniref:EthD family reductase n=1 Tax=Pseudokineococcus basanitobsidens TaxID=1926649 RepID=A0ABU8RJ44_9ACTN
MAVKLTVVYDNPEDPEAFEKHYASTHAALAGKVPDVQRVETAKVFPKEDGSDTPAYRTADLYFVDYATASAALATPEGQALAADVDSIATGGYRMLLSQVGG